MARPPRKIDTWNLRIHDIGVKVDVRMQNRKHGGTEFLVILDKYDETLVNEDINELKKITIAFLKEAMNIEWEKFYYIRFYGETKLGGEDDDDYEEDEKYEMIDQEVESKFHYELIEVGTKPDGGKFWRTYKHVGFNHSHDGEPKAGMDEEEWGAKSQYTLVPATPENKILLEGLARGFREHNKLMYARLSPKNILKTLREYK